MRSNFSALLTDTPLEKQEVILRAAVSKSKEQIESKPGRRLEQTIRAEEIVMAFPSGKGYWIDSDDALFAERYMGADRSYVGGVIGQSLSLPVLKQNQDGGLKLLSPIELNLAVTKVYQYALMYPTLRFFLGNLGFGKEDKGVLEEIMLELLNPPSNLMLSGEWDSLRSTMTRKEKTARLVISGSAVGVNNDFVYDEIYEEIQYLKDTGHKKITLLCFYMQGVGNARGDIRIPVTCTKIMKDCDVDFFRIVYDKEKYSHLGLDYFAYMTSILATHVLHFQPSGSKNLFNFHAYFESKGLECRELLLTNQQASIPINSEALD